jgi:hypothetical protein
VGCQGHDQGVPFTPFGQPGFLLIHEKPRTCRQRRLAIHGLRRRLAVCLGSLVPDRGDIDIRRLDLRTGRLAMPEIAFTITAAVLLIGGAAAVTILSDHWTDESRKRYDRLYEETMRRRALRKIGRE